MDHIGLAHELQTGDANATPSITSKPASAAPVLEALKSLAIYCLGGLLSGSRPQLGPLKVNSFV
jgi:hypothetical protein